MSFENQLKQTFNTYNAMITVLEFVEELAQNLNVPLTKILCIGSNIIPNEKSSPSMTFFNLIAFWLPEQFTSSNVFSSENKIIYQI